MKSIIKIGFAILFVGFLCFSVATKYTDIGRSVKNIINNNAESETKEDNKKTVFLTFDDGPSENTQKVLKILDDHKIKGTFFLIAANVDDKYTEQVQNMEKSGHSIGIHTFTHNYNEIYCSKDAYLKDFDKAYEKLSKILTNPPKIYRFPGGSCNCYIGCRKKDIVDELSKRGFQYFDWNVSAEDSVGKPTVTTIKENVLKDYSSFDKPVVLMHDSSINENTVKVLDEIICDMEKNNYNFDVLK